MPTHRIKRLTLELTIGDPDRAPDLFDRAGRLHESRLAPTIDRVCSELSGPGRLDRIDTLELELGAIDPADLDDALPARVEAALRTALARLLGPVGDDRSGDAAALLRIFARTGNLPWWAERGPADPIAAALAALADHPTALPALLRELDADPRARARLARYLDARPGAPRPAPHPAPEDMSERPGSHDPNEPDEQPPDAPRPGEPRTSELPTPPLPTIEQAHDDAPGEAPSFTPTHPLAPAPREHGAATILDPASKPTITTSELASVTASDLAIDPATIAIIDPATVTTIDPATITIDPATATPHLDDQAPRPDDAVALSPLAPRRRRPDLDLKHAPTPASTPTPAHPAPTPADAPADATISTPADPVPRIHTSPPPPALRTAPLPHPNAPAPAPRLHAERQAALAQLGELYVEDAGLVLLWPFLERFLVRVGLLGEAREFLDEPARMQAIALLARLTRDDPDPPEYTLPLAKLLCGLAPDAGFTLTPPLTPTQHDECEHLLTAVLDHLPFLQHMPAPAFRAAFLRRPAILGTRDGAWLLQVESRPHDLLLARFPWSWSWVKLGWMPDPMRVEWG